MDEVFIIIRLVKTKSFLFKQNGNGSSVCLLEWCHCITECKGGVIITYNNGILAKLSSKNLKVEWVNKSLFNLHKRCFDVS